MRFDLEEAFRQAALRGWSNDEFARRLGVTRVTLWRVRTGRTQPTLYFRERVRDLFPRVDPDILIRRVEEPCPAS